jgi:site-specific recombinase XerD
MNRPEYIPTLKQALTMAERCGIKRDRAIILVLITTGLRNSALRALTVGDIAVELKEEKRILWINVEANWNDRISGACKNCIPYYTFTAQITTEAIDSMLQERKVKFGSYSAEEPLFVSNYNQISPSERRVKPLTQEQLGIIVHKAAKAADISDWKKVHVHTMRKVFESILRSPLADGSAMDTKDQEFLMGHVLPGSQDNYYDRSKVERMRVLYSKLVFEDRSYAQEFSLETTRKIAKILGVDLSKVKTIKEKELGRPLSNQEEEELLEKEIKLAREQQNQEEQKIIQPSELDQYITSGWSVVVQLADGRVVVKRRSTTAP